MVRRSTSERTSSWPSTTTQGAVALARGLHCETSPVSTRRRWCHSSSTGSDRRYYFLGGPRTLRGYDYLQFQGPRMMLVNLEYRYPLVDAILFGWPGRWALTNIGGTLFLDSGSVWGEPRYVEPLDPKLQALEINDLKFYSNFGAGFFMRFGYLILDFQFGWPTDFSYTGKPAFHFYIGPQF